MTEPDLPGNDLPDDELDPVLQERFAALDAVEPPVTWPAAGSRSAGHPRRWLAFAAAAAVLAASAGWVLTRGDDGEVVAGDDLDSSTSFSSLAGTAPPVFDCPVTRPPAEPFVPPEQWAPEPSIPGGVWFGDDDLWTVLDTGGYVPRKSIWWSANFRDGGSEPVPEIAVIYERLDAPGMVVDLGPEGTNANTAADGWFMIAGGEPATPGCWQATATYKGATLSYVYEVPEPAGFTDCPDPQLAATVMSGSSNVAYDYQGSASPAELVASADHVVVGRVSGVGGDDGQVWIELSDLAPDSGLGGVVRVGYEFFASSDIDTDAIVGVRALAVLHDNDAAIGGLEVALEGLWFSCDGDAVAYPAKLVPTRDGWPVAPSINQLTDLIADPPVLVDGPVVRRSGQRSFADAQLAAFGDEADGADKFSLDGGCSWFVGGGGRTAIVWPPGTEHDDGVVTFGPGLPAVDGSRLGFRGVMLDAFLVRYEIGLAAGEAIEACVGGVSDAPVLVADTVVASPHGGVDGPLMFSAPWEGNGSEGALIAGVVQLDDDCIYVVDSLGDRYPVIWPHGTTWRDDPAGIVTPAGEFVALGDAVTGGGGYYTPEALAGFVADADALAMVDRCAEGEFREIAVVQGGTIDPA